MSAKKWFAALVATVGLMTAIIAALNYVIDPLGAFGDKFTKMYSFNMTNNPKAAKLSYIEENHDKYNAYIIGASGSSSLSVSKLNEYTGLSWYNMFNYGADMAYTRQLANYIISNYEVEHILLNLTLSNAELYNIPAKDATELYSPRITGALSYADFLFANPRYAIDKIRNITNDTYLPQKFDVFVPETGTYDKRERDIERIGSLESYLALYPEFNNDVKYQARLQYTEDCISAVAEIKALCDDNGIKLTIVIPPLYVKQFGRYDKAEVAAFYQKLAGLTEFADFSASSVSFDPRYFYDTTHFRNCVGDMMLARLFSDESVYVPEDFGVFFDKAVISVSADDIWRVVNTEEQAKDIPVLMYHHFAEQGSPDTTISPALFEDHITALSEAGYTAIALEDMLDYVYFGKDLPEKPIVITIDDGYSSNYEIAYPMFKKHGFKAAIFAIGVSVGKDTYKDTGQPIIPHFGTSEMTEMTDSGVISIQSHSYDMHQTEKFDKPLRKGVLKMEGESEDAYIAAFREDFNRSSQQIESATGKPVFSFSYPYGLYDKLSEALLKEMGVSITFSTEAGISTAVKGLPQSLMAVKRFNIPGELAADELLLMVGN